MSQTWIETWVEVGDAEINGDDLMGVLDPLWWIVSFYETPEIYEDSIAGFSRPQRLAYAMTWFDLETKNGGLDQFFSNSTGMVWADALAGFEEAGIVEAAAVLEESVRRLGRNPPFDRDERCDLLDEAMPDFSDLDDAYFRIEDIDLRILHFVRRHAAAFRFKGIVRKPADFTP